MKQAKNILKIINYHKNFIIITLFAMNIITCKKDYNNRILEYNKAVMFYQNKNLDFSLTEFKKIQENYPNYKDTKLYIGKIYFYKHNYSEAKKIFSEMYEFENKNLNYLSWIIKTDYAMQSDSIGILKNIDEYLKYNNSEPEILFIRADICKRLGKIEEAIYSYRRILLNEELLSLAHSELANIYKKSGISGKYKNHLEMAKLLRTNMSKKETKE